MMTVAEISRLSGLPEWMIYKTVINELSSKLCTAAEQERDRAPRKMKTLHLASASLQYAGSFAREDGYDHIWKSEYLDDMKFWASELADGT